MYDRILIRAVVRDALEYAMQTLRHKCYGRFLAHHVMECHGCNAKDACRLESTQRIFKR